MKTIKNLINWLISLIKRSVKWLIFQYNSIWNHFHYKNCIRKANRYHKMTGKRYYVVPTPDKLMVINNDGLKQYNLSVAKKHRRTQKQLSEMAYYSTPCGSLIRDITKN